MSRVSLKINLPGCCAPTPARRFGMYKRRCAGVKSHNKSDAERHAPQSAVIGKRVRNTASLGEAQKSRIIRKFERSLLKVTWKSAIVFTREKSTRKTAKKFAMLAIANFSVVFRVHFVFRVHYCCRDVFHAHPYMALVRVYASFAVDPSSLRRPSGGRGFLRIFGLE